MTISIVWRKLRRKCKDEDTYYTVISNILEKILQSSRIYTYDTYYFWISDMYSLTTQTGIAKTLFFIYTSYILGISSYENNKEISACRPSSVSVHPFGECLQIMAHLEQ